jgi:hypothetical protein
VKSRWKVVLAVAGIVVSAAFCLGLSFTPIRVQVNGWQLEVVRVVERTATPTEVVATATTVPSIPRPTATPAATRSSTPTPLPTATLSKTPTLTDSPTPTPCLPGAVFVADVTIPDGTVLTPGEAFEKVWRMRSSGCAPWPAGTRWVFISGDRMDAPGSVVVGGTPVGATVDVAVSMVAPGIPGTYKGYWQMQAPDGMCFGERVYVQVVVSEPASEPTAKPPSPKPTGRPPSATNEPPPP